MTSSDTVRIAASLWSVAPARLADEAQRLAAAGLSVWHWDRSDGSIAVAGGFDAETARRLADATRVPSEAHLMVREPLAELDEWLGFCERIVVHSEAEHWREAITRIRAAGVSAAVAVSPGGDTRALALPHGVPVLVMSVEPGHGGAPFRGDTPSRVRSLADEREVGVDGGVTAESARECIVAGARWIVSGTALLAAVDPREWARSVAGIQRFACGPSSKASGAGLAAVSPSAPAGRSGTPDPCASRSRGSPPTAP